MISNNNKKKTNKKQLTLHDEATEKQYQFQVIFFLVLIRFVRFNSFSSYK